jgi:nitrite reductase/ring-hydroxylating ferredoxin subunit
VSGAQQIDVERVICRLDELESAGARGFAIGSGDWPLRGFVVRINSEVRGFVNRCPHAGHPLNLRPHRFLTADSSLILCSSHGALFEKATGLCVAGPCAGQHLRSVPLKVESGFVMLADEVDPAALEEADR